MRRVSITEFRRSLPSSVRQVERGMGFEITVWGRAAARIVPPTVCWNSPTPAEPRAARSRIVELRKTIKLGDVLSPTGARWTGDWGNVQPKR